VGTPGDEDGDEDGAEVSKPKKRGKPKKHANDTMWPPLDVAPLKAEKYTDGLSKYPLLADALKLAGYKVRT
jgi:hypothetical protein